MQNRYDQLIPIIADVKPKTIVEVGAWDGSRAVQMMTEARKHSDTVHYVGFDLFEFGTAETDKAELNVKPHFTKQQVEQKLSAFCLENAGCSFELIAGDTKSTLPALIEKGLGPDFAFVDGGHSVATILSDVSALKNCPVVVCDDYYAPDENGESPDIQKFGCNFLFAEGGWTLLSVQNKVVTGGLVQMMARGWVPSRQNLVVKTKNCVEDALIQGNVVSAMERNLPMIEVVRGHSQVAVLCGGGPSLEEHFDDIRKLQNEGAKVFTVKTAHDRLINEGIIPYGCILLDPRGHVADFIESPHPEVIYFTASMVHPGTIDHLVEHDARICLYHALVNAGEQKVIKEGILLSGGSAAMTRGIAVLHSALGFHRFRIYGFDCCYPDKTAKVHGVQEKNIVKVEIMDREFWTDLEFVAQAQDIGNLIAQSNLDMEIYGDGMISHIWRNKRPKKTLEELTNAI